MDTNRIIINNYDLSTASVESPTEYTGFTVVKAPKGPITPVLIPAAGAARMQDIFGISSADYPELFEAELFNTQYSLYMSAPYFEASVPVAYLTNKGFYTGADNITYNDKVEYLALNGSLQNPEDDIVEGLNYFPETTGKELKVLKDIEDPEIIYVKEYFNESDSTKTTSLGAGLLVRIAKGTFTEPSTWESEAWGEETADQETGATTSVGYQNSAVSATVDLTTPVRLVNMPFKRGASSDTLKDYLKLTLNNPNVTDPDNKLVGELLTVVTKNQVIKTVKSNTTSYSANNYSFVACASGAVNTYSAQLSKYTFDSAVEATLASKPGIYIFLTGTATSGDNVSKYLTKLDLASRLDEEKERAALKAYREVKLADELNKARDTAFKLGEHIYAVVFPKYPSENPLHIEFDAFDQRNYKANSPEARNTLKITAYEENAFHSSKGLAVTFTGSLGLVNGAVPAFNGTNGDYMGQHLVTIYSEKRFKDKGELADDSLTMEGYGSLLLKNGVRKINGEIKTDQLTSGKFTYKSATDLHNLGWVEAKKPEYVDVDIFFDSQRHYVTAGHFSLGFTYADDCIYNELKKAVLTKDPAKAETIETEIADNYNVNYSLSYNEFFNLAKFRQTAGFLFNYTVDPKALSSTSAYVQQYQLNLGGNNGRQYWNVCNELVVDLVDGSRLMSPMIGSRALMQTRIIEYKYGGVAPEWTNSGTPSMGGQFVGLASTKLRFRYDKDQQDLLDKMNFNPVISDRTYGLMLTGHKTCQSGDLTDWSYIGHACSFLTFEKEVRRLVMNPQLGKPNNPYYRDLRKFQVEELLAKRLQGSGRIWAFGDCDTSTADGINDTQAFRAKQFRIKVRVKVDIYSEYVILDFYNLEQGAEV